MARDKTTIYGILLLALAILAYFYMVKTPHEGVAIGMVGEPFTIVNGVERGSQVAFTLTTVNNGNLPANISITSIMGNSSSLNDIIANLTTSMANQPQQSNPGDTKWWISSPIGLTALPSGQYSLTFTTTGTNLNPLVPISTKLYSINLTVLQQNIHILTDTPYLQEYAPACGTIHHGDILNLQVDAPSYAVFSVGSGACDYPTYGCHWTCLKKCVTPACTYGQAVWENCSISSYSAGGLIDSSGYYLIWRGASIGGGSPCNYPQTYGQVTSYSMSQG